MMKIQKKTSCSTQKPDRRRGRPAGKNRIPLSLEERRARNAQYERERRNETADAMAQLADAAGCDAQIANAELLARVISQLQRRERRKVPDDIDNLRRVNQNLASQIAILQSRLGQDVDVSSDEEDIKDAPEELNDYELNYQAEETNEPRKTKSQTRAPKGKRKSDYQNRHKETQQSSKIRKTSKSHKVRGKTAESDSDTQSDSSTNSNWSASVRTTSTQYALRNRIQKVSEQSECTTSSYPYRTSESSRCGRAYKQSQSSSADPSEYGNSPQHHSDGSNHPEASGSPENTLIDPNILTMPEQAEGAIKYEEQIDAALLDDLSESDMTMINQWIDGSEQGEYNTTFSETLNVQTNVDNKVLNFLAFDDFLLEINA